MLIVVLGINVLNAVLPFYQISDEFEDAKETPEEIAANFTCALFETPQDVLKGARHMVCVFCIHLFLLKDSVWM